LIKPALAFSEEKADILAGLYAKQLQLWGVYEHNIPVAGIVSRLLRREGTSSLNCRVWLIGGERLSAWAPDLLSKLIPWAKAEGCDRLSAAGRKGWGRWAPRYGFVRVADEGDLPCWERPI
jgi:hypothetical protein